MARGTSTSSPTDNRPALALIAAGLAFAILSALVLPSPGVLGWLP